MVIRRKEKWADEETIRMDTKEENRKKEKEG